MHMLFRVRLAFDAIFRKSATLQDVAPPGTPGADDAPPVAHSSSVSKKVQLVCILCEKLTTH